MIHTRKNGEIAEGSTGKSKEELDRLRRLSREIDDMENEFKAVVSVMVLYEGSDVQNVTTIVGLWPFNVPAKILPEQTLGRGLRRMFRASLTVSTLSKSSHIIRRIPPRQGVASMADDRDEALAMMRRLEPVIFKLAADVAKLAADVADLKESSTEQRAMLVQQGERIARLEGRIEEQSKILQIALAGRLSRQPAAE